MILVDDSLVMVAQLDSQQYLLFRLGKLHVHDWQEVAGQNWGSVAEPLPMKTGSLTVSLSLTSS